MSTEPDDSGSSSPSLLNCPVAQLGGHKSQVVIKRSSPFYGERLYNVIRQWKQEDSGSDLRLTLRMVSRLSKREQLVHSTPWMKEFILQIMPYPGFREQIVGRIRLLARICAHPLREVWSQRKFPNRDRHWNKSWTTSSTPLNLLWEGSQDNIHIFWTDILWPFWLKHFVMDVGKGMQNMCSRKIINCFL